MVNNWLNLMHLLENMILILTQMANHLNNINVHLKNFFTKVLMILMI